MSRDLQGKKLIDEIHPEKKNDIHVKFQILLRVDGMKINRIVKYPATDGSIGYLELTSVNLVNNTYIKGILMNIHDTTVRKSNEFDDYYCISH
ncbi:PAS domain S-box protein [Mobilitalea sibirica]|uniref:PAS domain S-box protein n=1 Tax=Mobilitalea sibirica TaxID=1462919 RepID=A0A8J7HEB6_9FIRM|nr:PAS domain S-box protein [Mobilitalea sibirica]MBH1941854.1 PAS domain S-box protein [Mobilitalea sibirica]